jgi:ribosomal protein L7Ae-like RNA K-turn-binding protein
MVGLARRAGQAVSGDTAVRYAINRKTARIVILAENAAERTVEVYRRLSGDAGIPLILHGTKDELGRATGKPYRAVVAITDDNLARGVFMALERGKA